MITHYFGTDTRQDGHYLWFVNLKGTAFEGRSLSFNAFPFNPEHITENLSNGELNWQHHISPLGSFTVCAIAGSPVDKRPGSKSVFIVPKIISFAELKEEILSTPVCKEIIEKMPFEIKWHGI